MRSLPAIIDKDFVDFQFSDERVQIGELMELLAALNLEPIFQLTFVALIMIAGPVVVFVLAFRGGDL